MITDYSRHRIRLKYQAHIEMGQSPPSTEYSSAPEDGFPFLQGTAEFGTENPTPHVYCGFPVKLAQAGDVLFSVRAPVGEINLANQEFGIGRGLCAIRPKRHWDSRFAWWALHEARNQLNYVSTGSTYDSVVAEDVGNLLVKTNTISAQRTIAAYLDRETERLDALVTEKEQLLELLTEKRRALVTHAVIRGLDPNIQFRDSGIPQLGKIPAHWEAVRLKFVSKEPLEYGANEAALDDDPSFPRFVRITDIDENGNLIDETYRSLDPTIAEPYLLHDGDILFARSGATVGKTFLYKESWGPSCFAGYLIRLRCNQQIVRPEFVYAYTQSDPYWGQLREGMTQATIQNFSAEKYGQLFLALPPLWEQSEIIDHLSNSLSSLDTLRSSLKSTTNLLRERRSALISAAVTGQLEVT